VGDALFVRSTRVSATHGLLLNKSCVGQFFSRTAAVNENPPTGIKLRLDLLHILEGLAEKMFQLIGHALEKDWAIVGWCKNCMSKLHVY
jgi:hypothetical protein